MVWRPIVQGVDEESPHEDERCDGGEHPRLVSTGAHHGKHLVEFLLVTVREKPFYQGWTVGKRRQEVKGGIGVRHKDTAHAFNHGRDRLESVCPSGTGNGVVMGSQSRSKRVEVGRSSAQARPEEIMQGQESRQPTTKFAKQIVVFESGERLSEALEMTSGRGKESAHFSRNLALRPKLSKCRILEQKICRNNNDI